MDINVAEKKLLAPEIPIKKEEPKRIKKETLKTIALIGMVLILAGIGVNYLLNDVTNKGVNLGFDIGVNQTATKCNENMNGFLTQLTSNDGIYLDKEQTILCGCQKVTK